MIIMMISFTKRLLTNQTSQTHHVTTTPFFYSDTNTYEYHMSLNNDGNHDPFGSKNLYYFLYSCVSPHDCICLTSFKITSYNFGTVYSTCRTPTCHGSVCLVCWIQWQDSPVTIWNIPRVHTGEVRPTMEGTVCFGELMRSSVAFFTSSHWYS